MNDSTQDIFLGISKTHLAYIEKIRSNTPRSNRKKYDHALVVIVTSACAVESFVNILLSLPILKLQSVKKRKYYSSVTRKYLKSSIRDKLSDLTKYTSISRNLRKDLKELFEVRNKIVHASPAYNEVRFIPDEIWEQGGTIDPESMPTKPELNLLPISLEYVDVAQRSYRTAKSFISSVNINEYFDKIA